MDSEEDANVTKYLNQYEVQELLSYCEHSDSIQIWTNQQSQSFLSLQQNITKTKIKHFQSLLVQIFYLFFVCLQRNINPKLHQNFIAFHSKNKKPCLLMNGFIRNEADGNSIENDQKQYYIFYGKIVRQIIKAIEQNEENQNHREEQSISAMSQQHIQLFESASTFPTFTKLDENNSFEVFKNEYDKVFEQIETDRQCFVELEKTNFIRNSSVIYKIRNCSLIMRIAKDEALRSQLSIFLKAEQKLRKQHRQTRMIDKKNYEQLMEIEKKIQKNMQKYFQTFKDNPKCYVIQENIKNSRHTKSKLCISITPINQQPFWLPASQAQTKYTYIVQYNSSLSIINVKLLTNIVLDLSNSDNILYKWNTMCFDAISYSLETHEIAEGAKKKKILAIKGKSQLNSASDSQIQKILILIQNVLAFYKSIEMEIKNKNQNDFAPQKIRQIREVGNKVNHYIKLVGDLCEKIFKICQ